MKISDGLQVEMFKVAAVSCAAALAFYLIRKSYVNTVNSLTKVLDSVISAPAQAIEAVKQVAKEGGSAWQDGITPQYPPDTPPPVNDPYSGRYKDPMINNDGVNFNLF